MEIQDTLHFPWSFQDFSPSLYPIYRRQPQQLHTNFPTFWPHNSYQDQHNSLIFTCLLSLPAGSSNTHSLILPWPSMVKGFGKLCIAIWKAQKQIDLLAVELWLYFSFLETALRLDVKKLPRNKIGFHLAHFCLRPVTVSSPHRPPGALTSLLPPVQGCGKLSWHLKPASLCHLNSEHYLRLESSGHIHPEAEQSLGPWLW